MLHPNRHITKYIGVGGKHEGSLRNAEQAKQVLSSTYLVQEYIDGGNLRKQVLEQVRCSVRHYQCSVHAVLSFKPNLFAFTTARDAAEALYVLQMCTNHLKKKHYTEAQALQWAIQIAKGLRYLHSAKPKVCAGISMH